MSILAPMIMAGQSSKPDHVHNVIIFVADGLRRDSVNAVDMPTFLRIRNEGVDFQNSHSVFPTFTTANASVIATGHGIGDTGDYSNTIYPGVWLAKPDDMHTAGSMVPFLENDEILADMNSVFEGNYLGQPTLLSMARAKGYSVASIGKLGPTAIQQNDAVRWSQLGLLDADGTVIVDDATGSSSGLPIPSEIAEAVRKAGLPVEAPLRTNGYGDSSAASNGFSGDAVVAGTIAPNNVQQQWFTDVTTKALLPKFVSEQKPFVLLFWSRDPDGTQHNQGDSLQQVQPGINGETSKRGLQNADRCLKQILDWLDAHPEVKANTDVLLTSDHGFATISRREIAPDGTASNELSTALDYELVGKEKAEPKGTLPTGFLAVDLAIRGNMKLFDPAVRATAGHSVYAELSLGGEKSQHPSGGSALLGESVTRLDGADAKLIVAANGGSDLLYVPNKDAKTVRETLTLLTQLDYVGGLFVDDAYCSTKTDCAGALPMSAIGLIGTSKVPRPAIVVTYKVYNQIAGERQTAIQISDTTLQEGQGMHGGFGREQTLNNMAAIGPDFKKRFVDTAPAGNIDIVPTLAQILRIPFGSAGRIKGRALKEALTNGEKESAGVEKIAVSEAAANGSRTVLHYQEEDGVRYLDRACLVAKDAPQRCE